MNTQEKMTPLKKVINQICQPSPKTYKTPEEQDALYRKNKVLFLLHILTILIALTFLKLSNLKQISLGFYFLMITVFGFLVFLLLCRSYPFALKIFYFMTVTLAGPSSALVLKDAFALSWISVHVLPSYLLYVNGFSAYIAQMFLQIIFSEFLYKPFVTNLIIHSNPVSFAEEMINVTIGGILTNLIIVSISVSALQKANQEVTVHKMKQNELERQKAFLLGFSHELRNITNSLLGNIQFALIEKPSGKVKDLLNSCELFGGLLLNLINNALDVGKAEVGELEVNPTSTVIYDTFEKIWNVSVQLIKNRQLEGYMRLHNKIPQMLKIDHYRLMQMIINLVMNAAKFTEKGNVTVDVQWIETADSVLPEHFEPIPYDQTDEGLFEKNESISFLMKNQIVLNPQQITIDKKKIENCSNAKKGVLKIIVRDHGCGIHPEKLPHVFKKADENTYNGDTKRLGIRSSLYVTKCLVEKMNGEIKAYSQLYQGATFILCLPLEVAEENWVKAISKEEVKTFVESSNLKVLIVDDMQFNRMILKNYLKNLKITATPAEAKNGQEALEIFQNSVNLETKTSFDIITMDVEMPVMDGKKAVELIRNHESEHNLNPSLIIMVSGNCSESEVSECLNPSKITGSKNADFFLKKPTSVDDLSNVIISWYQKKFSGKNQQI